jgi:phosphomannomutase
MAMKKILFFDVDDTVCPSTQPLAEDMSAELNRLLEAGRVLAFISGSTAEQIWGQLGPRLKGEYHLLGTSGTRYVRVRDGVRSEQYHEDLEPSERERILGLFRELAARQGIRSLTTEDDQIQDRGSQITFSALGRHAPEEKKRAFDPDRSLRRAWAAQLRAELGEGYQIGIGGTTSLDITRTGRDKGWGIRQFLKYMNLDAKDAIFFGDNLREGGNDYPARAVLDCVEVESPADTLQKLKALL